MDEILCGFSVAYVERVTYILRIKNSLFDKNYYATAFPSSFPLDFPTSSRWRSINTRNIKNYVTADLFIERIVYFLWKRKYLLNIFQGCAVRAVDIQLESLKIRATSFRFLVLTTFIFLLNVYEWWTNNLGWFILWLHIWGSVSIFFPKV